MKQDELEFRMIGASFMCLSKDDVLLSGKSAELFKLLTENKNEFVEFTSIANKIWNRQDVDHKLIRTIDVHLHHIKKITKDLQLKIVRKRKQGVKLTDINGNNKTIDEPVIVES